MLEVLKSVFDTFGSAVFVPVMIFIVAKVLRVSTQKSFLSGLYAGVGLMGFTLILNAYTPIISKVVQQMVSNTGINLPVFDVGWQATALVAYSTEAGMIYLVIALLLQTILFFLKWVNVFQPSDLWNNYSYMVWGSMVYLSTESMMLAVLLMCLLNMYSLLLAEMLAKRWSTYYGYPNCTIISMHNIEPGIFALVMDPIWNKLGLNKININPQGLQKRLGFLGEPISLGLFLGLLLGVLGNLNQLFVLSSWGQIAQVGIATAAVMAIFPKIAGIFAQAFAPISGAASKSIKGQSKDRTWFLGINDATGYGEPATLISGILLIPIMVVTAIFLPGNTTLPVVDLLAIPYMVQALVCLSNGNITKVLINGTIWFSLGLYICSHTAPMFTQIAGSVGVVLPAGALMITSFNILGKPIFGAIFLAFLTQSPLLIGICIVAYFVIYFAFRLKREAFWDYLERAAALNIKDKQLSDWK